MDLINLKSLNLTAEESEDLIKLLTQKRGIIFYYKAKFKAQE